MVKEEYGIRFCRSFSAEFSAEAVNLESSAERSQADVARNLGIGGIYDPQVVS